MEKISVIIPIYNVEKFMKNCIDSVINQTYKNLEIILVDDGATDSSGKICDEYKQKDSRIEVIHQKNMGLAGARNTGLDVATGKYVMFLDSDDFYEKNSCEVLYNEIEKRGADYVIGNYIHTNHEGVKWENPIFDKELYTNFKLDLNDYKKSFFVMNSTVWNKIFKREFIEKFHLRFVHGAFAEDAIFSTFCYVHTDNAYYINDIVYNYRQNKTNSTISTTCTKRYFTKINEAYKLIYKNFEETNEIGFYRYFYSRITPYLMCKLIDTDALDGKEETIEVMKMLYWFFKQKDEFDAVIVNTMLNEMSNAIIKEDYEVAYKELEKIKEYRKGLNAVAAEKMYAPNQKLYQEMSKKDFKYIKNDKIC